MPLEVEAPGPVQRSGHPAVDKDCRGEHRPAWPTGKAAGRQPPPPLRTRPHLNGASLGVKVEGPQGVVVVAMRGDGGGVAAGATTAAVGSAVVMLLSPVP
jgi:hypothetical protein